MNSLIEDISALTSIPVNTLDKLKKKTIYCICDSIEETKLRGEDTTVIDMGIGILYIKEEGDIVKYRFTPSKTLENSINTTLIEGKNPLVDTIEKSLVKRVTDTYKQYI